MKQASGATRSFWTEGVEMPRSEPLRIDAEADVCVVGAGIAGLTTAYQLCLDGRSVVVLDDGEIGGGETARTTAHLASAIDDRFCRLERVLGEAAARVAAESHAAAIDRIGAIAAAETIACDFERVDGWLFLAEGESRETIESELGAARRAGVAGVEICDRSPLAFDRGPALCFPRQGQVHALRYLAGLAGAVLRRGARIHTGTHVDRVEGGDRPCVVTSSGRSVRAGSVVVATNSPISDLVSIHTKQAAYRTYAIAARVPAGAVPKGLFWDTLDAYHYVRTHPLGADGDVLIVGGEDHKTGQAEDGEARLERLADWARERFPSIGPIEWRWSGQVMETIDGLAFIGADPGGGRNVWVATGDSGMGMTHGTIAGLLLADLIAGRENDWASTYDPSRKTIRAAYDFVTEGANVALQYTTWLTGGDVSTTDEIAPGSGAVLRSGVTKIAVYRDADGRLHRRSAVCPHLGCIVAWNSTEKSWDCPCHGSRFDPQGCVLNGPATAALAEVD